MSEAVAWWLESRVAGGKAIKWWTCIRIFNLLQQLFLSPITTIKEMLTCHYKLPEKWVIFLWLLLFLLCSFSSSFWPRFPSPRSGVCSYRNCVSDDLMNISLAVLKMPYFWRLSADDSSYVVRSHYSYCWLILASPTIKPKRSNCWTAVNNEKLFF